MRIGREVLEQAIYCVAFRDLARIVITLNGFLQPGVWWCSPSHSQEPRFRSLSRLTTFR